MKKTLYSTTALAAAGLLTLGASDAFAQAAAPAAPEKLKIAVGGFMTQLVGWADQSGSYERANSATIGNGYKSFDVKNDSEIFFSGSVKLDNGLTVAVMVQLEADQATANAGTTLDESFMTVSGDFGAVKIGATDFATLGISVSAPWTGARNPANADVSEWNVKPSANALSTTCCGTTIGGGDSNMITYTSPSLAGFRVAGSWRPSATESNAQPLKTETEQWDLGVQWAGAVGDFGLRAYTGYWSARGSAVTADSDNLSFGADVKWGDITVGGGFLDTHGKAGADASSSNPEATTWEAGVLYAPAGYAVGLRYSKRSAERLSTIADDDTGTRWLLGAKYNIGPGVDLVGTVARDRYESETNTAAAENTALSVLGGIAVSF